MQAQTYFHFLSPLWQPQDSPPRPQLLLCLPTTKSLYLASQLRPQPPLSVPVLYILFCNPLPSFLADLPDCPLQTGSTVPPNVLCTSLRPDLVILFPSRKIIILELTVPFEFNISDAHSRKTDRYSSLITDLKSAGFSPKLFTLEVGSRGLFP